MELAVRELPARGREDAVWQRVFPRCEMIAKVLRRVLVYDPPDPVEYWSPRSEQEGFVSVMWRNPAYNTLADRDQWRVVTRFLPARRGAVLDLGCGTGRLSERLAARFDEYVGIDIPAMVSQARKRLPELADCFVDEPVQSYAFESERFDLVLSMGCLAAAEDRHGLPGLAEKMVRAVRPGGRILMIDPFHTFKVVARRCRIGGKEVSDLFLDLGMTPVYRGGLHFIPARLFLTELGVFQGLPTATKLIYELCEATLRFSPRAFADYSVIVLDKPVGP